MIDSVVAEGKIRQALGRLGLSFIDAMHIIEYDPDVETAYWSYNAVTGEEKIRVGPEIAELDISSIEIVLRHEFLHRSTYHGFREYFPDDQLLNIVEDICINRLLFEAYPEKMQKLAVQFYSPEAKKTIIALADCSADPDDLPEKIASLWHYIWDQDENGGFNSLNPPSLYYRILEVRNSEIISFDFTTNILIAHGSNKFPVPISMEMEKATNGNINTINGRLPGCSDIGKMMNAYLSSTKQFSSDQVKNFLEQLHVDRMVSASRENLLETFKYTLNSVYPYYPSSRGLTYLATGLSEILGLYHIVKSDVRSIRLKIAFYVDVSGSMEEYFNYVHYFVKAVFDVPLVIKIFDDTLRVVSVDDYMNGRFSVGGGTDFNLVIKDILEDDTIGAGLLFTDGQADINLDLQKKLKASNKKVFAVYFTGKGESIGKCDLDNIAEKTMVMQI